MVTASDRAAVAFSLSAGNVHDAPEGRKLLDKIMRFDEHKFLLMDRAYEGDDTRAKVMEKGYVPVVPPKRNRKEPWDYNEELYKQRNEIERFFLRLKRFRRVFTRYDKLDVLFSGFIFFALIADAIISLNML